MQRRAIQLAKNTIVISLPSSWIKQKGIKKGDELRVEESAGSLVISTGAQQEIKRRVVDATGLTERTLRWALSGLHKQGVDEIEIQYANPFTVQIVQDLIRDTFLGFALISQKDKSLVIRQISRDADDQFDVVLRRSLLVTLSLTEGFADALQRKDWEELTSLEYLEKTNNQLTNFCIRLIHRGEAGAAYPMMYHTLLWNMEKIADEYKHMIHKIPKKPIVQSQIVQAMNDTASLLRLFYNCFYQGDLNSVNDVADKRAALQHTVQNLLHSQHGFSRDLAHHTQQVITRIGDLCSCLASIRTYG